MGKRLLLFFSGLLLLGVALFPHTLFLKIVELTLSPIGSFSCAQVGFKEGALVFEEVKLKNSEFFTIEIKNAQFKNRKLVLTDVFIDLKKKGNFAPQQLGTFLLNSHFETEIHSGTLLHPQIEKKMPWTFVKGFTFFLDDDPLFVAFERKEKKLLFSTAFSSREIAPVFQFFSYFLLPKKYSAWKFSEGKMEAHSLALGIQGNHCDYVEGKVFIELLKGRQEDLSLLCRMDSFKSAFHLDFKEPLASEATLLLKNGALSLSGSHSEFWQGMWDLHLLEASIKVEEGCIKKSQICANLLGMEGDIAFHGNTMELNVAGESSQMLPLLPTPLQGPFKKAFPEDSFRLATRVRQKGVGTEVEGELIVKEREGKENRLDFGCHFGEKEEECFIPPSLLSLENLTAQFNLSFHPVGWFRANQVSLEKFLSPFLLHGTKLTLSGLFDFEGTFDENALLLYYRGKEFDLESPHFSLTCDNVEKGVVADTAAFHYVDLRTGKSQGYLPLVDATYKQKNVALTFSHASFIAYFQEEVISLKKIETEFQDLKFKGDIKIDLGEKPDLQIHASSCHGSLSAAKELLSQCIPSLCWKLPLEGEASGEDLFLHFLFEPKAVLIDAKVQGSLNAHYKGKLGALSNYRLHFAYDKRENCLDFKEGKGDITLSGRDASYQIETERLTFSHFPHVAAQVALRVTQGEKELFHVAGKKEGGDVLIGGNILHLHAKQEGKEIAIQEFQLGSLIGKGAIQTQAEKIISHLEIASEEMGGFTCSCEYDKKTGQLFATFPHLSLDLATIFQTGPLHTWAKGWNIAGKLEGAASLAWDFSGGNVAVESLSAFTGLECAGVCFGEGKELKCGYSSENGFSLQLQEGTYLFLGKTHELNHFSLSFQRHQIELTSLYKIKETFYPLHIVAEPSFTKGTLYLKEKAGEKEGIKAQWKKEGGGFRWETIEGKFLGLEVSLGESRGSRLVTHMALTGKVGMDFTRCQQLLSPEINAWREKLNLGEGYWVEGDFVFNPSNLSSLIFSGKLLGRRFGIGGLHFNSLSSEVVLTPNLIEIKNMTLDDWGGQLEMESATLKKTTEGWDIVIPHLHMEGVQLSRLKAQVEKKSKKNLLKPLNISYFSLRNFKGRWGQPLSFEGSGELRFTQQSKQTLFSNLLLLPKEITARLGLDLNLLVPSHGNIHYRIGEGRVNLSKFKGVYSEGKRSRFYLEEGQPAYIDFAGNLNLKIKMKQYNLLMKLAEFFVITVKGSVFDPDISFTAPSYVGLEESD